MRVLLVVPKAEGALYRLCLQQIQGAPWHSYRIATVHPTKPRSSHLEEFAAALGWAHVIHFLYWKTASFLLEKFEVQQPKVLTHYNPYDLNVSDWSAFQRNVVVNQTQLREIQTPAVHIPLPVDLDYWRPPEPNPNKQYDIIMVANRIENTKGILPVAEVATDLGLKMALVGDISNGEYFRGVMATGNVQFFRNISDDDLRSLYQQSRIHISNSIDNFESGTLPLLEAMASEVPVITRRTGHVPDLDNGRNMLVRSGEPEDKDELREMILRLLADQALRQKMAEAARDSIMLRSVGYAARAYSKLYQGLQQDKELVSAILPTTAEPQDLRRCLDHVMAQTYGPMEIIVVDDSDRPGLNEAVVQELRETTEHTLKFYRNAHYVVDDLGGLRKTYGLARARNKGILEAEGTWIWLVDDRILPAADSLMEFYNRRKENAWLWGVKDGFRKSFVENFSFVSRSALVKIGMFNEQIAQYGGQTQDVRTRAERLHQMELEMVPTAEAEARDRTGKRWKRYPDIARSKLQCHKLYGSTSMTAMNSEVAQSQNQSAALPSAGHTSTKYDAFSDEQLLETFHGVESSSKHLLIFYSLIVGVNAQTVLDLGLGNSTRTARAAVRSTGGVVYSCDYDKERFGRYESLDASDWKFFCIPSRELIDVVPEPIDVAFHDASHEHDVVRDDLVALFPKMRQFGLVCVHDTQHPRYTLLEAVHEAVRQVEPTQKISLVTLPFGCGLTVLRVETSAHPPIEPAGKYKGDRVVTVPRTLDA